MLQNVILSITSILNTNAGQTMDEVVLDIPVGESVIESNITWNALTMFSTDGSSIPKIWYQADNQEWRPWYYADNGNGLARQDTLDLLYAGEQKQTLNIRAEEPISLVAHFYNTKIPGESLVARFDPFDDDSNDDPFTGLARPTNPPKFISRSQWGADESIRHWKITRGLKHFFRTSVPETSEAPKFMHPKVVETHDADGNKLTWPLEQNRQIKKFIIHHTGEVTDEKRNPQELMRAIYYYHAISRGWGDIGYNYVIDKQGNIYEGRAGGPLTIGAHTAYHNLGTIGISLMGNFEYEQPTDRQINVLELLLADHANRFRVNPTAKSFYLDRKSYNISGHRDVARKGHGTACPGKNLQALLPELRKKAALLSQDIKVKDVKTTRDFLSKSSAAPKFQRKGIVRNVKKAPPVSLAKIIPTKTMQRDDKTYLEVKLKNGTTQPWKKGQKLVVKDIPEGMRVTSFRATEAIPSGSSGLFRAKVWVKSTPNGQYNLSLEPQVEVPGEEDARIAAISYPLQVSGSKGLLTKKFNNQSVASLFKSAQASSFKSSSLKQPSTQAIKALDPRIKQTKIKLAFFDEKYATLSSQDRIDIRSQNRVIKTVPKNQDIKVIPIGKDRKFRVSTGGKTWELINPQFRTTGVIQIENYDRGLGSIAYNQFRRQLNFHATTEENFYIVNQLPIEEYLWGLAEEPSTEPDEKKHAIHILARSYALVYSGPRRKFKTVNYDLEDDPRSSQFYLGYDWERYHGDQKKLVAKTTGKVITHNSKAVIGPYFTQSGGESSSAWKRQYPWTRAQKLPYDEGLEPKGHGIGFSGNTARELAKRGQTYEQLLHYFFDGIEIEKKY